ncbi:MAG: hypothetical protein AB1330_01540 [Bacillota bacterium]
MTYLELTKILEDAPTEQALRARTVAFNLYCPGNDRLGALFAPLDDGVGMFPYAEASVLTGACIDLSRSSLLFGRQAVDECLKMCRQVLSEALSIESLLRGVFNL